MNSKIAKNFAYIFFTIGVLGALYSFYILSHRDDIQRDHQLASLIGGEEKILNFDEPTKFSDCRARGPLPDPDCTPGDIFKNVTKEQICISGYSKTVRKVSQNMKNEVFNLYSIEHPVPFGSYEIDHLIPLSLGGSNEMANLWPKSAEPFPGFFEKNVTGNYLKEEVCAGKMALSVAQEQIAKNWFLIYQSIDPIIIENLKNKYPNWAETRK